MALVRRYGRLEDGGECEHPSPCKTQAVARVPNPAEIASAGLDLCPLHLALYADTRGDEETLQELGVDDLVATNRFLALYEAPPRLDRRKVYHRIGVDHRGLAHYYEHGRDIDDKERILTVNARLELLDVYQVPNHLGLSGWVDHVDERRAWIQLDDGVEGGVRQ